MDDIFEQMLSSSSPWGGDAASAANPSLLGGSLEMSRSTLYEDDGRLPSEVLMFGDAGHLHALQAPPLWNQTYVGALSPSSSSATHGLLGCGKQEAFLGDPLRDLHLGKRPREGDDIIDGQPNVGIQGFGDQGATLNGGGGKPRVRARRGQATDPHSIAERNRRERIAERMKALQELVPDSNKTDKASMLDEIIGYVKFLQMQVKCLSMCRLGGAGATAPLLSDLSAEGGNFAAAANMPQGNGGAGDGITLAEHQVARLMDEDMSAAMQYLQSKGLCLMPISLATVISSSGSRNPQQSSGIGPSIGPSDGAESMKQAMELAASFAASVGATTQNAASMMGSLSSTTNSFLGQKDAANAPNQRSDGSDDGDDLDDDKDGGLNNLKRPSIPSLHNRTSKGIRIRQDLQR